MSGIWGWFGGGGSQRANNAPKNAILGLRGQLDMLQKREAHLTNQINVQDEIARKNVNTNKATARTALKRKKAHEHALEQTMGQISTLEQQINAIESANINRETLKAMEKAREAMTAIHGPLTVEKVDATMESLREQNALSDEIVEVMNNAAFGNQVDEDELEDELEQMQQEQLDEQMTKTGTVPVSDTVHKLPAAANGPIKGKAVEEEDDEELEELRKLQAEMAM